MKLELDLKNHWDHHSHEERIEALQATEAALRMSYGQGFFRGGVCWALIDALRRAANDLEAGLVTHRLTTTARGPEMLCGRPAWERSGNAVTCPECLRLMQPVEPRP